MMKKFINDPQTVTDEELVGLGLAFSDTVMVLQKQLFRKQRICKSADNGCPS